MTMVRDIELVQLLEDVVELLNSTEADDSDDRAREHLLARLETEIRRRKVLR